MKRVEGRTLNRWSAHLEVYLYTILALPARLHATPPWTRAVGPAQSIDPRNATDYASQRMTTKQRIWQRRNLGGRCVVSSQQNTQGHRRNREDGDSAALMPGHCLGREGHGARYSFQHNNFHRPEGQKKRAPEPSSTPDRANWRSTLTESCPRHRMVPYTVLLVESGAALRHSLLIRCAGSRLEVEARLDDYMLWTPGGSEKRTNGQAQRQSKRPPRRWFPGHRNLLMENPGSCCLLEGRASVHTPLVL